MTFYDVAQKNEFSDFYPDEKKLVKCIRGVLIARKYVQKYAKKKHPHNTLNDGCKMSIKAQQRRRGKAE